MLKYLGQRPLRYVVLTEEYSEDWKLNGRKPMKAYSVVNAYLVGEDEEPPIKIVYERFYRICLPSYIISLLTFMGCIAYLLYFSKEKRKST